MLFTNLLEGQIIPSVLAESEVIQEAVRGH